MVDWKKWRKSTARKKKDLPADLWMRCQSCGSTVYKKVVEESSRVCPECNYHFTIGSADRIELLMDTGSFEERFTNLEPVDPLSFNANAAYVKKLAAAQKKTGLKDAAVCGTATIKGIPLVVGITDPFFMVGSMGSVVGEKLARSVELAHELALPLVVICGSGGGARMHEGALSLWQMAKVSAALGRFRDEGGFFLSLLTNATMGGTMASFASLGDLIIAEPKALVGFTGPRVIRQTIRKELPEGFQTSEFMLDHGFIDLIVDRKDLRDRIAQILDYCRMPRLTAKA